MRLFRLIKLEEMLIKIELSAFIAQGDLLMIESRNMKRSARSKNPKKILISKKAKKFSLLNRIVKFNPFLTVKTRSQE